MDKERYNTIDIIKGIVIVFMILRHVQWQWTKIDSNTSPELFLTVWIFIFIGSAVGPYFLIVSGTNMIFYINNKINHKELKKEIFIQISIRALLIFSISTAIQIIFGQILLKNIFNLQIDSLFYWSIFQTIAVSQVFYMIMPFLKRLFRILLYFVLSILMVLIEFIINIFHIEPLLFLTRGDWHFFPYTIFFILGMLIGDIIYNASSDKLIKKILISSIIIGITFTIMFFLCFDFLHDTTFIPLYVRSSGLFFILFPLIFYFSDMREKTIFIDKSLARWGKVSFSLYYFHWGIIGMGLLVFPILFDSWNEVGFLFIPLLIALLIIIILVEVFVRIWEKFDFILGLEWIVRKLTPNNLKSKKNLENNLINEKREISK